MKIAVAFILMLLCFPALFAQDSMEKNYKIYDLQQKSIISADELIEQLKTASAIFFGEEHNDAVSHYLESVLFQKLYQRNPGKIVLSMEMFESDIQPVLNEYLQGLISERNMIKEARAWSNYKDYSPLIEFAKKNRLEVIAANSPARYTNMVTRNGLSSLALLSKNAKQIIAPLPIDTATGRYYQKFLETMGGHSAMGGMQIYQSQNLWDATMAYHIAGYLKKNRENVLFHLNGRFHSDEKLGTVAQLKKYAPKLTVMNISSFSDKSFNNPDWEKFTGLADFVIITNPEIKTSY